VCVCGRHGACIAIPVRPDGMALRAERTSSLARACLWPTIRRLSLFVSPSSFHDEQRACQFPAFFLHNLFFSETALGSPLSPLTGQWRGKSSADASHATPLPSKSCKACSPSWIGVIGRTRVLINLALSVFLYFHYHCQGLRIRSDRRKVSFLSSKPNGAWAAGQGFKTGDIAVVQHHGCRPKE